MTAGTTTAFTANDSSTAHDERLASAEAILRRNVLWAGGAGLLPLPLFDLLVITAIQVKTIKQLSDLYDVPFREDLAKKLVASLLTGIVGVGVGVGVAMSLSKLVPVLGTTLGVLTLPVVAGAATHATGKVFILHFETGGTLLDFDARAMRAHFKTEYEGAKDSLASLYKQQPQAEQRGV